MNTFFCSRLSIIKNFFCAHIMKKEAGCQFSLLSGSQEKEKYIELFCASKLYLRNCEKKSFVENDGR